MLRLKYYINHWIIWQASITTLPWALRLERDKENIYIQKQNNAQWSLKPSLVPTEPEKKPKLQLAWAAFASDAWRAICPPWYRTQGKKRYVNILAPFALKSHLPSSMTEHLPGIKANRPHVYFSFWMEASSCRLSPHSTEAHSVTDQKSGEQAPSPLLTAVTVHWLMIFLLWASTSLSIKWR